MISNTDFSPKSSRMPCTGSAQGIKTKNYFFRKQKMKQKSNKTHNIQRKTKSVNKNVLNIYKVNGKKSEMSSKKIPANIKEENIVEMEFSSNSEDEGVSVTLIIK